MKNLNSTIGAYDAKTHFSALLERVGNGEEITITRHGLPVARLVPVRPAATVDERHAAIQSIRDLAKGNRLRGLKVKQLIAEGRR